MAGTAAFSHKETLVVRTLSDAEVAAKKRATESYQQLATDSLATITTAPAKRPD